MNKGLFSLIISSLLVFTVSGCSGGGSDDSGNESTSNQKPTANAGQDQTTDEQTEVTISGSGSDSDGSISSYSWTQTSGEAVNLTGSDSQNLTFTSPVAKTELTLVFELTVTDNDGATDKDSVEIIVLPVNEEELTIQGKTEDGPTNTATVTTTISGQIYETETDANGNYSLDIEFDEDDLNKVLVISARGVGEESKLGLATITNSLEELMLAAGDDGVLAVEESVIGKMTPLTSAIYGLSIIANDGNLPELQSEYDSSLLKLDGREILNAAAALKLIVDNHANNIELGLPEDKSNMLDFVTDRSSLNSYLVKVSNYNSEYRDVFYTAFDEVSISVESGLYAYTKLPEFYTMLYAVSDVMPWKSNFDIDNSNYIERTQVASVNWKLADGRIVGDFIEEYAKSAGTIGEMIDYDYVEFKVEDVVNTIEYSLIKESGSVDIVSVKVTGFTRKVNPNYPDYFPDEPFERGTVAVVAKAILGFSESDIAKGMAFPIAAELLKESGTYRLDGTSVDVSYLKETYANLFEFSDNGTVKSNLEVLGDGQWEINALGQLVVSLPSIQVIIDKYTPDLIGSTAKNYLGDTLGFNSNKMAVRESVKQHTMESFAGVYAYYEPINEEQNGFWLEFFEDGTGYQISGVDSNQNGVAEKGEYRKSPLFWEVKDNKLVAKRYIDITGTSGDPFCEQITPDCMVFHERVISVVQDTANEMRFIHTHNLNTEFNYGDMYYQGEQVWSSERTHLTVWRKLPEKPMVINL